MINSIKNLFRTLFKIVKYTVYATIVGVVLLAGIGSYIEMNDPEIQAQRAEQRAAQELVAQQRAEAEAAQEAEAKAKRSAQEAARKQKGFHCLSSWDGSLMYDRPIKQAMKNPSSYEHIETKITPVVDGYHRAVVKFRAQNGFGGMNIDSMVVNVDPETCKIVERIL